MKSRLWFFCTLSILLCLLPSCGKPRLQGSNVEGQQIRIEFDRFMHSRVVAKFDGKDIVVGEFVPSEFITVSGHSHKDFTVDDQKREAVTDKMGLGKRFIISGTIPSLRKTVAVTIYEDFPSMAFFEVKYTNTGGSDLSVDGWTNHRYSVTAPQGAMNPAFWSYQSGSYESRPDWVLPLKVGFKQDNYQGMNASDYGGGTPIVDVWRREVGIGVGHIELSPKLVSLPVTMPSPDQATVGVNFRQAETLKPGSTLKTLRTFVAVHQGDYFQTLSEYRRFMIKQGIAFKPAPEVAYAPIWCAWGFGRTFTPSQVYNALPIVKKLGFGWVTLDDGWQTAEGDWFLNKTKFPNGDRDIKTLVDRIHAQGFKAQLWWAPLAVKPGSELLTKHPEQLLLNADGSKQKITWWDSWYLCPADPAVVEYHRALVMKIVKDWGFDGLKLDGQFMNGAPPCYNSAHKHPSPEAAVEAMPTFFKALYDTALSLKPDALVEFCPCGTAYSFFTLPYMNMSVASDPKSSWQVRLKGKTLKALTGDAVVYFGDHVDMSDGGDDFASTVGVGGVIGTNFTWPVGAVKKGKLDLTPRKEKIWEDWVKIYKDKMLPKGEYLGALYDIGFDRPETHAIRRGNNYYFAIYAPEWKGQVQLRGLESRPYHVTDYENKKDLGAVNGPAGLLSVEFQKHLLLEARPE
jgi:alpha-galactosidase